MEKLKKCWLVLVKCYLKLPALVRYCIELSQRNPNNEYWNDNKPVLKIPLASNISGLGFLNTN